MACAPWPKGKKLVHLDLKGAPPRVEYLHKVGSSVSCCWITPASALLTLLHCCVLQPVRCVLPFQLIELFSQLGANGLLVEYEDTFPYERELKLLQATTHPAYRYTSGNKHVVVLCVFPLCLKRVRYVNISM